MRNRLPVLFMANDEVRAQLVGSALIYTTRTIESIHFAAAEA